MVKLVCSLDFDAASSAFSEAKNAFGAVQPPSDQEKVLKKSLGRLDMAEADTEVASDLVGDSNTATSVKDRAMLRKRAGHLLGGAERLVEQIIGDIEKLEARATK